MGIVRSTWKIFRLGLLGTGAGWMFALLTFNFNRVTDSDLGAAAILITTLIGLHHFLSPFQVFWGRLADRYPLWGYRRSPHILLSAIGGSILFVLLPGLAIELGQHNPLAIGLAFIIFSTFGILMSANGGASNALVAEVTTERERDAAVAVFRIMMIVSIILTAGVSKMLMPTYDPQQMQYLYNLTPLIVITATVLGLIGLEKRLSPHEHRVLMAQPRVESSDTGAFQLAWQLLSTNRQVRWFFVFVLLSIMGIFLQDAILEPFGAEVFGLIQAETATFTQIWGGSVLLSMIILVTITRFRPIPKKALATVGGVGTALGLLLIALTSMTKQQALLEPGLIVLGISTGVFNIGAVTMMMEMTIDGHTGIYMGLWGMANGLGNGLANALSGTLKTAFIETGLFQVGPGYGLIFGIEALMMLLAVMVLRHISVQEFRSLSQAEITTAMVFDTAT
ncbi:MAG: BCD family MFS transporter [Chloroflexaceae bacterium]|nr:BCD family MFS transporter [Chloroflexaceae bacterium]